jgi:hypothetical protein
MRTLRRRKSILVVSIMHSYPKVVSFNVVGKNVYSEHMLKTESGTGFTTTNTDQLTCPSLDSAITSQDVLTDTTNSKA